MFSSRVMLYCFDMNMELGSPQGLWDFLVFIQKRIDVHSLYLNRKLRICSSVYIRVSSTVRNAIDNNVFTHSFTTLHPTFLKVIHKKLIHAVLFFHAINWFSKMNASLSHYIL